MEKRKFAIGFTIAFGILTFYLWQNNDRIARTIAGDGINGIFWYFLSNTTYILLLISIYLWNAEAGYLKNILGGLLIILATDIVSYPRLPSTGIPLDISILASSDYLFMQKLLNYGLSYSFSYTLYYLVMPILLLVLALWIMGISDFAKRLVGK